MMKVAKTFIIFLIFSIIFNPFASAIIVDTNVFTPTEFATMKTVAASPTVLESKILVAGETTTMSTTLIDGKISISDSIHTFREVSMDYQMLLDELEGFNGKQIALTHINDEGEIDSRRIVSVSPDVNGYVSVIMEFSTTIVDGFTGTTTTTLTGLSGNQSISVPDGSSYDLNITNNKGVWIINGTNYTKRLLKTINQHSEQLTDYQINYTIPYDSDMQSDMDDRVFTYYENDTLNYHWDELVNNDTNVTGYLKVPSISNTADTLIWMYYSNQSVNSLSSIFNTGITGSDDFSMDLSLWTETDAGGNVNIGSGIVNITGNTGWDTNGLLSTTTYDRTSQGYIFDLRQKQTGYDGFIWGYRQNLGSVGEDANIYTAGTGLQWYDTDWSAFSASLPSVNTWFNSKIILKDTNNISVEYSGETHSYTDTTNNGYIGMSAYQTATATVDWVFIHKYTTTEPTWSADGAEQTVTVTRNITASITGDSNEQSYNKSQSREFTLTPTGSTNNVFINTTSTDYDVTVTTYWTEDTVKISETVSNGYANITVQYTPSNNITAGVINATYNTIDFASHDYTGTLSVTVDDVDYSSNGTRLLNDVNTTIVNFDTSTHYINFSVPYNPPLDLYSPNNTATLSYAYPPLTHDVVLSWEQSTGTYKYTVTDYDTGATISSSTVSSNTTTVSLSSGQYKWYINGYDDVFGEYSQSSAIRSFTVEDTFSYPNDTVVHGVVYEYILGVQTPLDTALVNIWNNTWSGSSMTGTNGYFIFTGLHNSTYSMRATKDGYIDSNIELVTPVFNTTLTRDILLQSSSGAGQQYIDHYVKFIVKSLIGTLYSDVEVNVYLGDAVIPQYTGTTGTDGSISFELNEYQEYRITFEKTSPSIDREITIYPKDDSYTVYVDIGTMIDDLLNPDDEEQAITAIDVSVTKTIINDNTANITVNYNDIMDETSGLTLTLSQSIAGNTTNKTILSTVDLGTANNTAYNFTVTNYNGESYLIEIEATHTTHGAIYRMYGIQFENTDTLFGFTVEVVGWLAIIFLTWFALTATSITVQHTAIGVCALATAMIAIGWGSYISMSGLGLAWIMSLAANFAHAKEASA